MPPPFQLREYQREGVEIVKHRNAIVVLPTNSGKTVIAAEQIRLTLQREEKRKVIFLAPYAALARQQAELLLRHVEQLHLKEDERAAAERTAARWRLGLVIGGMHDEGDEAGLLPWFRAFDECQCLVMTSSMLVKALIHAHVKMADIALLVLDEVHRHKGDDLYTTVTKYWYARARPEDRPRVLGLTASPIDETEGTEPSKDTVEEKLASLENSVNALAWSRPVQIGHLTTTVRQHEPEPTHEVESLVNELLDGCKPNEREAACAGFPELHEGWTQCMDKVKVVATELGVRPCLLAVNLLADSLKLAAARSCPANAKPWFVRQEDEKTSTASAPSPATKLALRELLTRVAEALTTNVQDYERRVGAAARRYSHKTEALLAFLHEQNEAGGARKCLIFVPRRIVCKLLAKLLEERLPGWSVAWVVAAGKVGIAAGLGAEEFSLHDQADAIGRFKEDLRVLVATSIVEEGMDVPACDLVVNFDPPRTSREHQQRGGRARAPHATFASLISSGKDFRKAREGQERLNSWNKLVAEVLNMNGATPRPPLHSMMPPPEQNFLETTEGALLPLTRAKDFLHSKVYGLKQPGQGTEGRDGTTLKLDFTGDGKRFEHEGKDSSFDVQIVGSFGGHSFQCTLTLPGVKLCSAKTEGKLPHTLLPSRVEKSEKDAKERAALDGCRYLHKIGVLDAHLRVVGRDEQLATLRQRAAPRRSTRRDNAYYLGLQEPAVRRLPRCLLPPADGVLHELWAHPIALDDSPTQLALLLPAQLPEQPFAEPFMLGAADSTHAQRQLCRLGRPFRLKLDAVQLKQLVRFHVATFDLVQAGNAGEPLHPLLAAPRQLIRWNNRRGTFSAEELSDAPEPAVSDVIEQLPCDPAEKWHDRVADGSADADQLAELLRPLVCAGVSPVVAVFDLDHTLWAGRCDEWPSGSFERFLPPAGSAELRHRRVYDKSSTSRRALELHVEVPLIFDALRRAGVCIAIASASAAADSARDLLAKFELDPEEMLIEMADPESRAGATEAVESTEAEGAEPLKARQLRSLAEQLGVPIERLVLFDDMPDNTKAVRDEALGAGALLVDKGQGLTVDALLRGLDFHAKELDQRRTSGLDDSGFTTMENELLKEENGHDARRKAKQDRQQHEGSRQALIDAAPARARLAQQQSEAGLWLVAPLAGGCVDTLRVDWEHVHLVSDMARHFDSQIGADGQEVQLGAPTLNDRKHELVQRRAEVQGGGVRYEMCGLATWRRRMNRSEWQQHFNLMTNVQDHVKDDETYNDDESVSGDQEKRSIGVGASTKTRSQQADGVHRTKDTKHEGPSNGQGRRRDEMQLLPLCTAHVAPLKAIRRIVWRVEHLALMAELDGLQRLVPHPDGTAASWLPASAIPPPLPLLVSAMTHKMAQAERLEGAEATADATRADARGCCNYEVAEFLGDAALDLLAKLSMMASKEKAEQKEGVLNQQAELILGNRNLYQRAMALGLSELGLFTPFQEKQRLPDLRKALISRKIQADVVEALLGVVCLAQLEDDPHGPGRLGRGLDAAKAFFDVFVHPQPGAQPPSSGEWVGVSQQLQDSMGKGKWERWAEAPGQSHAELIEKALLPTGTKFTRRADLLPQCCSWNKHPPFQRLEFLGDAFLQYVISCELRERYPLQEEGFLTSLRSVLVHNLHLGRLLTRRLGADVALRFFERDTDQHRKIKEFILSVPGQKEVLNAVWAYEAKRTSEEKVMDVATTTIVSKSGEEPCKPTGDVYEALMGLVLLEFEGDVDRAWRIFKDDFFPHPRSDEEEAKLISAYREERNRALKREVGARVKRKYDAAEASQTAQTAQAQTAETAEEAEAGAPAAPEPMQVDAEVPAVESAQELAAPAASSFVPPRPGLDEEAAIEAAIAVTTPPASAAASGVASLQGLQPLDAPAAPTGSAPSAAAPQPRNPRGQVETQLRRAQLEPDDVLEVDDAPSGLKHFACIVRSKRTRVVLGQVEGCTQKKQASKEAWLQVHSNPMLTQLIEEEVSLLPQRPPTPPLPAAPALPPPSSSGAVALLSNHVQAVFHRPASAILTYEYADEGCSAFGCMVSLVEGGKEIGASSGHPRKAAAKESAAERALHYLLDNPPQVPTLPPPPSLPLARPESMGSQAYQYTYAMDQATPETLAPLFEILRETSSSYQKKITRHVRRCGLDDASLTYLASNKRTESETSTFSAGRLFHDKVADEVKSRDNR